MTRAGLLALCACPRVYAHSRTSDSVWRAAQPTVPPPIAAASASQVAKGALHVLCARDVEL